MIESFKKFYHKNITVARATIDEGLLERFLSRQRARLAHRLINERGGDNVDGRVLDIGCGSYPVFLLTSKYREKYGLDRIRCTRENAYRRVSLIDFDIESSGKLPFEDGFMDVVVMLAVFEHLEYKKLQQLLGEIYRILRPEGMCVLTTPARWAEIILRVFARIGLVSRELMEEHKTNLKTSQICDLLKEVGFARVKNGFFECFLNRWFLVKK